MSEHTEITVEILNRRYRFQVQVEDREALNQAVEELQGRIRAIVEESAVGEVKNESIVASAALNLAKDYLEAGVGVGQTDDSGRDVSRLLDELEDWLEEKDDVSTILVQLRKSATGR